MLGLKEKNNRSASENHEISAADKAVRNLITVIYVTFGIVGLVVIVVPAFIIYKCVKHKREHPNDPEIKFVRE